MTPRQPAGAPEWFRSVDSAPATLSVRRGPAAAIASQALFLILSVLVLQALTAWPGFQLRFPSGDLNLVAVEGRVLVPIRIFLLIAFVSVAAFLPGPPAYRAGFLVAVTTRFFTLVVLADGAFLAVRQATGLLPSAQLLAILSGFAGFGAFAWSVLDRVEMPHERLEQVPGPRPVPWPALRAALFLAVAVFTAYVIERAFLQPIMGLRAIALLGGVGPGVFLVLPLFFTMLALRSARRNSRARRVECAEDLAVLIPAHNEAHVIAATLEALDRATVHYAGRVTVYVIDNASSDDTARLAEEALNACHTVRGRVWRCPTPGKAKALNYGLGLIKEALVLRLDADTQLDPPALAMAARHMADPHVGVVGGLPFPQHRRSWIARAREIEILIKHGFYQIGLDAIDATVGVPGMAALYRVEVLRRLGGFAEGMNGEDTDMSLRIGECGYRLVTDLRMTFRTEVPETMRHLREQRLRWFRSVYHVTARNRRLLQRRPGMRSRLVVPWYLVNGGRRALMIQLGGFGLLCRVIAPDLYPNLDFAEVLAVFLGAPALLATCVVVAHGRASLLPSLPLFLAFRVLRAHLTLDSAFSMQLRKAYAPRRTLQWLRA